MSVLKRILGSIRRADRDFGLIRPGDSVAVGVSGGKDSLVLLHALSLYRRFSPNPFELRAVTVSMGLEGFDPAAIGEFCRARDIPWTLTETEIGRIVFEGHKDENPCSLCSRLRRGALAEACRKLGCSRLALGHHRDDALETLMMSVLYEGRLRTFPPLTRPTDGGIPQIRPLIYCTERELIGISRRLSFPTVPSPCPVDGKTARAEMKKLLDDLCRRYPNARQRMLTALKNDGEYALWTH